MRTHSQRSGITKSEADPQLRTSVAALAIAAFCHGKLDSTQALKAHGQARSSRNHVLAGALSPVLRPSTLNSRRRMLALAGRRNAVGHGG